MMKQIFIIRHAKSDHGPKYGTDFERPLNPRGREDAARMAQEMKKGVDQFDRVLVSSAARTRETAAYFIETFDIEESRITYDRNLYLPAEEDIWDALRSVDEEAQNVVVFTHNPAAETLFHRYHPGEKLPTSSILELHYDGDSWQNAGPEVVRFISHRYPKMYG